jgi:hypothetical protein
MQAQARQVGRPRPEQTLQAAPSTYYDPLAKYADLARLPRCDVLRPESKRVFEKTWRV